MKKIIGTSEKYFKGLKKSYPSAKFALNELLVNAYFVENNKNIEIHFSRNNATNISESVTFINDGNIFEQLALTNAISKLGCESPKTAGNENGVGIKSASSYLLKKDGVLIILSKENNSVVSFGAIWSNGEYSESLDDLTTNEKLFFMNISSMLKGNGTAVALLNTAITKEDIDDFLSDIPYMFSFGLLDKNIIAYIGQERIKIEYIDRHCKEMETMQEYNRTFVDETFEFRGKIFMCDILLTNTEKLSNRKRNKLEDENAVIDYGCHFGYENGYMPIYFSNVSTIGNQDQPQYYNFRMTMVAKPINGDGKYANVDDWKNFYTKLGNINQQKVTNLSYSKNKFKEKFWEDYLSVIKRVKSVLHSDFNLNNFETKVNEEKLEEFNKKFKSSKYSRKEIGSQVYNYTFGLIDELYAKFDVTTRTITFTNNIESPFIKTILKGGRNGKNGTNDLDIAIRPTIDLLNNLLEMEETNAKRDRRVNAIIRQMNHFYAVMVDK